MRYVFSILALALFLFGLTGCIQPAIYSSEENLPQEGWHLNDSRAFDFLIKDHTTPVDLFLQVRNNEDYPYRNMYVFVDIDFPDGGVRRDTVSFILATPDGRWIGEGGGSTYDNDVMFIRRAMLPDTGTYSLRIGHGMRDSVLVGVERIGLIVEASEAG